MAAFALWPASSARPAAPCEVAFAVRDWARAATDCRGPRWSGRDAVARAWIAWGQDREDAALALAEQLLDTGAGADAAYLAGYIRSQRGDPAQTELARTLLERALHGYQRARRHADASRAAGLLSRVSRPERRFSEELQLAQLAVAEAELSGDRVLIGRASQALAVAYDWIGMATAAREQFLRAEQLTEPRPTELAHTYVMHAGFLLDLGTRADLEASLPFFDAAAAAYARAVAQGHERHVAALPLAIRLNRADALSQLGRLDAADHELAIAERELGSSADADQLAMLRLVRGYVAARRDDTATAERLLAQVESESDGDTRWRVALELARSYRAGGDSERAERSYRTAIAIVEKVRSAASSIELRPSVLARRITPYLELLSLLVEQDRGVDALVIAESLHARAWLDVVLGPGPDRGATAEQAVAAAQIRYRLGAESAPPLDADSLLATVGDREALVFLASGAVAWRAHVARGQVELRELPAGALDFVRQFIAAPGDPEASARASTALLPAALSSRDDPLYIVATGPLEGVPFAALRWRGRYLIEGRAVARLHGLAALRCAPATWDDRVVVLGDSLGDLPEARREARELAAASGVVPGLGPAATRQVVARSRGAALLHLAAHGVMTSAGRAIALADGNLTASDVLDAGIDPEVVVLSGCATATSSDAESWDGFPSAFLAAGSRYVVATLRSIDDAAAARVTAAYHAQPASLTPIERLAAAQRQLLAAVPVADWASFAAWGAACDGPRAPVFDQAARVVFPAACEPPSSCLPKPP